MTVLTKDYPSLPADENEILRYAGAGRDSLPLVEECLEEVKDVLSYKVCYCILPVSVEEELCRIGRLEASSKSLARALRDCNEAVIFAATVGVGLDRLLARYSRLAPSRALILQAIGAERVEALCDAFVSEMSAIVPLRPRFSPGYGDLPLDIQRRIVGLLDCPRRIGLCLNDSLVMSPSKSVTAIAGIHGTDRRDPATSANAENIPNIGRLK